MNEGLAIKSHVQTLHAFIAETICVLDVVVDAIKDCLASLTCCQQRHVQAWVKRCTARNLSSAQFLCQVVGAHDEDRNAWMSCNLAAVKDGCRSFDHRPDHHFLRCARSIKCGRHFVDFGHGVDLGNHDCRNTCLCCSCHICMAPWSCKCIATNGEFTLAIFARVHCSNSLRTCNVF